MGYNFSIIASTLFVVSAITLFLGAFVYWQRKSSQLNRLYFLLAITLAAWIFTGGIIEVVPLEQLVPWIKAHYIAALLMANLSLVFVLAFTHKERVYRFTDKAIILALATDAFFVYLISIKDSVVVSAHRINGLIDINFGDNYSYYVCFLAFYFLASLMFLVKKFKRTAGIEKKQLQMVIIGSYGTILAGFFTNLILPWFGNFKLFWAGPALVMFLVLFFGYAITKYGLFNIRIITTEIFVVALSTILFLEIFVEKQLSLLIFRGAMFALVAFFGFLLIKNVFREIRTKEEIQKLALDLQKANIELKRLDRVKSEFLSIASHQLRTPLTAIKGYSSLLLENSFGQLTQPVKGAVSKIFESSKQLVTMVDDFLNISRIETGRMSYEFTSFDLNETIQNIVNDFTVNNKKAKELNLVFVSSGEEFKIRGDKNKLSQVISNLIDNALKYTSSGFVKVSAENNNETILIKVRDSGIGIPKEIMLRLFQKFSRSDASRKINTSGSGLGLYVAKRIIDDHGGKIWAKSEGADKGSVFFVELPVA